MILVLGGIASGKRTYVASLGYDESQMSDSIASSAPVLCGLQDMLREGPLSEEELEALQRKEVVVCCEVGQGVVPLDPSDRAWRELVGRTCARLARHVRVVRMVCGIPVTIKEA